MVCGLDALTAELCGWEGIGAAAQGADVVAALEEVAELRHQLSELTAPHLPNETGPTRKIVPEGGAVAVPVVTGLGDKLLIVNAYDRYLRALPHACAHTRDRRTLARRWPSILAMPRRTAWPPGRRHALARNPSMHTPWPSSPCSNLACAIAVSAR